MAGTKRLREITKEKNLERGKKDNGVHIRDQKKKRAERNQIVETEINQSPPFNNKYCGLFTEGLEF